MGKPLLSDELWEEVKELLPVKPRRKRNPGRRRVGNREALTGIIFILKTGMGWEDLPQELGCGCGMTCWRRMREWLAAGVWDRLQIKLLEKLDGAGRIDWSRAAVDSSSVRAVFGGARPVPIRSTGRSRAANTMS
jgi:transposase